MMNKLLNNRDSDSRRSIGLWPRLLDVFLASIYLSVGEQTIRDYIDDEILRPIELPGAILRGKNNTVIARPRQRRMNKILIDREDLDQLILEHKANNAEDHS